MLLYAHWVPGSKASVAAELEVVEEQVEVVVVARELDVDLAADKGEAAAQLQQEALDVIHQRLLDLALAARVGGAEKVEQVRVLEDVRGHVGVGGRQGWP